MQQPSRQKSWWKCVIQWALNLFIPPPITPKEMDIAESSNKSLIRIIKKLLEDNKKNWDAKLKYVLWTDRVTIKRSTSCSPFKLVYGTDAIFPIQLTIHVAKLLQIAQNEEDDIANRITDLT